MIKDDYIDSFYTLSLRAPWAVPVGAPLDWAPPPPPLWPATLNELAGQTGDNNNGDSIYNNQDWPANIGRPALCLAHWGRPHGQCGISYELAAIPSGRLRLLWAFEARRPLLLEAAKFLASITTTCFLPDSKSLSIGRRANDEKLTRRLGCCCCCLCRRPQWSRANLAPIGPPELVSWWRAATKTTSPLNVSPPFGSNPGALIESASGEEKMFFTRREQVE